MRKKILENLAMGVNGEAYEPQGGLSGALWGQRNIDNARFQESVDRIQNMGKPGGGIGFKTTKYGLPNATWDRFNGLMMGLRDGTLAQGGKFEMEGNAAPEVPNTRFDPTQVGVATGQTLGQDQQGFQESLNRTARPSRNIIGDLRRRFGL